jgi:hypothetical protein
MSSFFGPSIDFMRALGRKPERLIPWANTGTLPQYDCYLRRNPEMWSRPDDLGPVVIHRSDEKELRRLFFKARSQYRSEASDYWDDILPGDCEDQCLWYVRSVAHGEDLRWSVYVAANLRLVVCRMKGKDKWHALLVLDDYYRGSVRQRIIDFRMTAPLLPVNHPAFDDYDGWRMLKSGSNQWLACAKVKVLK